MSALAERKETPQEWKEWVEANGGSWGEHPEFTQAEWRRAVAAERTLLGYLDWVVDRMGTQRAVKGAGDA